MGIFDRFKIGLNKSGFIELDLSLEKNETFFMKHKNIVLVYLILIILCICIFTDYLIKKKGRSMSGVVVVAVTMPPLNSCSYNCSFCPSGKDTSGVMIVPKSYDPKEPAIARGLRNNFNGVLQFYERGNTYLGNGHIVDKTEVIIRGGTFHC